MFALNRLAALRQLVLAGSYEQALNEQVDDLVVEHVIKRFDNELPVLDENMAGIVSRNVEEIRGLIGNTDWVGGIIKRIMKTDIRHYIDDAYGEIALSVTGANSSVVRAFERLVPTKTDKITLLKLWATISRNIATDIMREFGGRHRKTKDKDYYENMGRGFSTDEPWLEPVGDIEDAAEDLFDDLLMYLKRVGGKSKEEQVTLFDVMVNKVGMDRSGALAAAFEFLPNAETPSEQRHWRWVWDELRKNVCDYLNKKYSGSLPSAITKFCRAASVEGRIVHGELRRLLAGWILGSVRADLTVGDFLKPEEMVEKLYKEHKKSSVIDRVVASFIGR